jgi:hypothetical protein
MRQNSLDPTHMIFYRRFIRRIGLIILEISLNIYTLKDKKTRAGFESQARAETDARKTSRQTDLKRSDRYQSKSMN